MNFDLSEEQKMLRDAAQKFLRAEYRFDARNKIFASVPGMSRDGSRAGDLRLDAVVLGKDALLGAQGEGLGLLEHLVDLGIVAACADALGAMGALLRKTGEYVSTRKQFDVPIASFQVIQHRLVDMFAAVEASRSLVLMAALHAGAPRRGHPFARRLGRQGRHRRARPLRGAASGAVARRRGHDRGTGHRPLLSPSDALLQPVGQRADHHLQRFAALRAPA